MYKSRGFNISDLHADMEFECIRNNVLPSRLNVTAANDHVGKVKQSIWTMKERARTTIHGLPFRRLPTPLFSVERSVVSFRTPTRKSSSGRASAAFPAVEPVSVPLVLLSQFLVVDLSNPSRQEVEAADSVSPSVAVSVT
jgi:hypothetical protein